jgi:hypothetical protein
MTEKGRMCHADQAGMTKNLFFCNILTDNCLSLQVFDGNQCSKNKNMSDSKLPSTRQFFGSRPVVCIVSDAEKLIQASDYQLI